MKLICDFYDQKGDIVTFKANVMKVLQKNMINVKVINIDEDQNYKNQISTGSHVYSVTFAGDPTELLKVFARHSGTTTNKLTIDELREFVEMCRD